MLAMSVATRLPSCFLSFLFILFILSKKQLTVWQDAAPRSPGGWVRQEAQGSPDVIPGRPNSPARGRRWTFPAPLRSCPSCSKTSLQVFSEQQGLFDRIHRIFRMGTLGSDRGD